MVCTQQLVWTLLSLLRESYLLTHRSILHVLLNESYFFVFIWPAMISPPLSLSLSLSLSFSLPLSLSLPPPSTAYFE